MASEFVRAGCILRARESYFSRTLGKRNPRLTRGDLPGRLSLAWAGGRQRHGKPSRRVTYTVLVRDSSRIEFVEITGLAVTPPEPGELAELEAFR